MKNMNPIDFIHELSWEQIPKHVQQQAKRCLLDTIGAAIGGRRTKLSHIIYDFAGSTFMGKGAFLWLDGREVSPAGAALAHGMTIDALDIHDNFNSAKGHAGVAIIPTALATLELNDNIISGRELLTTLVVGYEIALRAGLALHATACDYHTSGAWNALGCAALVARRLKLSEETTRHALGIAEYHGPRSQMMRVIDHPTMLKDGSGWGAMSGVSAGLLAHKGFTGAPAITVEAAEVAEFWADIGERWYINEQDFKRYAVCHWAQPPIAGTLELIHAHNISPQNIDSIQVYTFHAGTHLTCRHPKTTEEAQYSLPFPVAAAVIYGDLGPDELSGKALTDPRVLELADRIEICADDFCNNQFPSTQMARVCIKTTDGQTFESEAVEAPWDRSGIQQPNQPPDDELREKFAWLAADSLPESRTTQIEEKILNCDALADANALTELLTAP
ncbi:MAG: MmgE/PrpD family protein [Chloroflexota bacterium]|nr:MmgE/PrpD family protein [Chloroflexota bacterium]